MAKHRSEPIYNNRRSWGKRCCGSITTASRTIALCFTVSQCERCFQLARCFTNTPYRFSFLKGAYQDTLCLRYDWTPERLPSHCFLASLQPWPRFKLPYRWFSDSPSQQDPWFFSNPHHPGMLWYGHRTSLLATHWRDIPLNDNHHWWQCSFG